MVESPKIIVKNLTFAYGDTVVLEELSASFEENRISAITGPSGRGKSTFLTVLNRLWENSPGARMEKGEVLIRFGKDIFENIYAPSMDPVALRRKVGLVFQAPNPLPMSIMKNMMFPLKLKGGIDKRRSAVKAKTALQQAFLWDEVKDRLDDDARTLSGGQQQRLCIARALILEPEVLLLDEPTASLDANAGKIIESLLVHLKSRCTLLMVSHDLDQVKRVADQVFEIQ